MLEHLAFIPFIAITLTSSKEQITYPLIDSNLTHKINNKMEVPFVHQKEDLIGTKYESIGGSACGPAAITMALNYHGEQISLEEVIDKLPDRVYVKGKMFYDLMAGPKLFGYASVPIEKNIESIFNAIKEGHPVLLNVQNYDGITGHEVVVVEVKNYNSELKTAEALIVHDPFREGNREFKIIDGNRLEQPEGYILPIGTLRPFYIIKSTMSDNNVEYIHAK